MIDALSTVRQFTSEGNLSRNGNLNTTTMREMWDYESHEPFSGKTKDASEVVQKNLKIYNHYPKLNVNYVVEAMKLTNAPMKENFVWG